MKLIDLCLLLLSPRQIGITCRVPKVIVSLGTLYSPDKASNSKLGLNLCGSLGEDLVEGGLALCRKHNAAKAMPYGV